jgi:predicted thioesterase
MLNIGDKYEIYTIVKKEYLASSMKSGCLEVFATPMVVAFMEEASLELAQKGLPEGITTVGTMVNVEHISPTPLGAEVKFTAELTGIDNDRFYHFNVEAEDKLGVIARGIHTRASVKADKFQKKADEKFEV